MSIEIINTSKFVELSDFVFSAIIDEDSFNADYNKNSSIIQKSTVGSSQFVWFIQNQLDIKSNDIIFCHVEVVDHFFNLISNEQVEDIILISGQSDKSINEKIFSSKPKAVKHWFSTNVECINEFLHPIPLGVNNDYISMYPVENDFKEFEFSELNTKKNKIYSNFNVNTRFIHRHFAQKISFKNPIIHYDEKKLNKFEYLEKLNSFMYILSPWGNGIDSHRIWEALYANSIPIVKNNIVFSKFKSLPIMFVDNFKNIKLTDHNNLFETKSMELCDFKFWRQLIFDKKSKENNKTKKNLKLDVMSKNILFIQNRNKSNKLKSRKKQLKYFLYRIFKKIF